VSVIPLSDVPPGCPASGNALQVFVIEAWGAEVDAGRWATVLDRRERRIRELRAAGDPHAADALGWLTLAAILGGLPVRLVGTLLREPNPAELLDRVTRTATDGRPALLGASEPRPARHTTPYGFDVIDAGSREGWALAGLAGHAAGGKVVVIGSTPTTPDSFRTLLRRRIDEAVGS
jgi:hypothetical protein